jgi:hypothetical protein
VWIPDRGGRVCMARPWPGAQIPGFVSIYRWSPPADGFLLEVRARKNLDMVMLLTPHQIVKWNRRNEKSNERNR